MPVDNHFCGYPVHVTNVYWYIESKQGIFKVSSNCFRLTLFGDPVLILLKEM